eukprot:2067994-Amphidinium_carterae.1
MRPRWPRGTSKRCLRKISTSRHEAIVLHGSMVNIGRWLLRLADMVRSKPVEMLENQIMHARCPIEGQIRGHLDSSPTI